MGVNYTINHLREKYLVIHVREEVKRVNRECRECARRFKVQPVQQQMAPLPRIRLQMTTKPFARARAWTTSCQTLPVLVYVLANALLPFGDGDLIRNRRVSQRIRANDGKKRVANENAK